MKSANFNFYLAQHFFFLQKRFMNTQDPRRNVPTEKGRDNDPNLRDESAIQPGITTVSDSEYDDNNEELTETAADDFREESSEDSKPDPSFDEVDYD